MPSSSHTPVKTLLKVGLLAICFFSAQVSASPGAEECPKVRNPNPEGNYIIPGVMGGIVYKRIAGIELSMDAYIQRSGANNAGVIVLHGGGWTSGSRITHISQLLETLTRGGYNWFSVDYRLSPLHKFPAALDDVRDALKFIQCNARYFKTDPKKLALMGDDAGGHLAALLASERPPGVQAAVMFGAPLDLGATERFKKEGSNSPLEQVFGRQTLDEQSKAVLAKASPIQGLSSGMPALLLVHGSQDREVPPDQADLYCSLARKAGNSCKVMMVEGGIHFIENWRPELWSYKQQVLDWLAERIPAASGKPVPRGGRLQKDIAYSSYVDKSGTPRSLLLDAYRPAGTGPFPAVVIVHGGGWEAGDKITYVTPVMEWLAREGFAWFSIDYRLTPEFRNPDQLEDVRRAIRFVRQNSDRFRIDRDRIAILGESASGQLVTQIAAEPCEGSSEAADPVERQPCRIQAVVSFYGVYDFIPMAGDASPRSLALRLFGITAINDETRTVLRRYSPYHQASRNMPPVLLIHGTNERLWQQGQAFAQRLETLGVPYELLAVEGAPHGMENWEGHPEWMNYKSRLSAWLSQKLR